METTLGVETNPFCKSERDPKNLRIYVIEIIRSLEADISWWQITVTPLLSYQLGSEGNTGHLYTKQAELIKTISPDVAIIEQTDNAININHGEDVKSLLKELQTDYLTHHAIIPVWRYGDPTNRKRLFIVAFHRRLGPQTQSFQFPKPTFDNHHYPTAANVSVPDNDVPRRFILEGGPIILYTYEKSKPGHIHHLGIYGP